MFSNHIKFALRILKKDGIYSVLNVLGLTLGITVGIILFLYLQSELNYDKHHTKADRIYRFTAHLKADGADFNTARTPREIAPRLLEELAEVQNYVRFNDWGNTLVTTNESGSEPIQFYEDEIYSTDSTFLDFFTHEVLDGNPENCLEGPKKVVLTESIAKKYYGDVSPVGKTITFDENDQRTVSAVISDLPENSHLKYTILLSAVESRGDFNNADAMRTSEAFWNPGIYTYLMLPEGYNPSQFPKSFESIFEKYYRPFADRINGTATPLLQPLTSIHFGPQMANDEPRGNINYVYTFSTIGLFLILLACINYMNLATARSVYRAGEIAMRKVLGKTKANLFWSILTEAMVVAAIAMILSIVCSWMILNLTPFNSWIDKSLAMDFTGNHLLVLGIVGITLTVGLISGVYPAIYIPSMPVVSALKGSLKTQSKGILLRKVLIVLQFAVSIFVIITTVLMDRQIDFMKQVDLGFNQENVVLIGVKNQETNEKMDVIKAELEANPNIISVATAYGVPGVSMGGQVFRVESDNGQLVQKSMLTIFSGKDYLETIGYELIDGRDFYHDSEAEINTSYIVNEAGAKELGWGDNAIGKRVRFFHGQEDGHVVGVVKDFNIESLHNKIEPLFILLGDDNGGTIHVRIKENNVTESIEFIESVITRFDNKNPFDYTFLDTEFDKQYRADQIQHQLISTLSYICIFISILGLIGLSAFSVSQKSKEISIRKTLGGSMGHILMLFSKEYIKLIIIAIVIAIPIADYVIIDWLSAFAYQMPQEWVYYIIPGVMVLLLGFLTVFIQVMKAAKSNPADGLRSE
ncbi:MAG: ABC transporter permease [Bacteroidota bacterium]